MIKSNEHTSKIDVVYGLPDRQEVLKKLIDSPQNMTPYGLWYAGYFSSELVRQTTLEGQFSAQELWFIEQIRLKLEKKGEVRVLGLGEGLAFGLTKIASYFASEIDAKKVMIVSTNYETDFSIYELVEEARRRLTIFGTKSHYMNIKATIPYDSVHTLVA